MDNYIQGDISKFNTLNLLNDILSIDFLKKLNNLSTANWKHLETDLIFIKHELSNKIQLYSNLIPPEILGKLLIVNKEFESLNSLFGLLPDLFTKEQSEWPPNDKGLQNNIRIRTTLLTKLAENFKEYFVSVKNFSDVLEGWEKR